MEMCFLSWPCQGRNHSWCFLMFSHLLWDNPVWCNKVTLLSSIFQANIFRVSDFSGNLLAGKTKYFVETKREEQLKQSRQGHLSSHPSLCGPQNVIFKLPPPLLSRLQITHPPDLPIEWGEGREEDFVSFLPPGVAKFVRMWIILLSCQSSPERS